MSEAELVKVFYKNNKMSDIMRIILQIDKQHNGYVTVTELDDILKLTFKEELANKDTRPIMRKYASI